MMIKKWIKKFWRNVFTSCSIARCGVDFNDWKDSLERMKKKSLEDGLPPELVERTEILVQVSSAIPDIGGLIGFLKAINQAEGRARVVVVSPNVMDIGKYIVIDTIVPLDVISIVGATMDTMVMDNQNCNCSRCQDFSRHKINPIHDDKDGGKVLMFNKFKRNDECE